jgi:hypothetical protein
MIHMAAYDSRTKLEALRDHFEVFAKGANYLLVAHGAGLAGCLAVLKDHPKDVPQQFQGLGLLILLFCSGLLLGSLFWFMTMWTKINVTQAIISQNWTRSWRERLCNLLIRWFAYIGLWGSLLMFVVAIALIMYQFRSAVPPEIMEWQPRWRYWLCRVFVC